MFFNRLISTLREKILMNATEPVTEPAAELSIKLHGSPSIQAVHPTLWRLAWAVDFDPSSILDDAEVGVRVLLHQVTVAVDATEDLADVQSYRVAVARLEEQTAAAGKLREDLAGLEAVVRQQLASGIDPTGAEDQIDALRTDIARRETRLGILRETVEKLRPVAERRLVSARRDALAEIRTKADAAVLDAIGELMRVAAGPVAMLAMRQRVLSLIPAK